MAETNQIVHSCKKHKKRSTIIYDNSFDDVKVNESPESSISKTTTTTKTFLKMSSNIIDGGDNNTNNNEDKKTAHRPNDQIDEKNVEKSNDKEDKYVNNNNSEESVKVKQQQRLKTRNNDLNSLNSVNNDDEMSNCEDNKRQKENICNCKSKEEIEIERELERNQKFFDYLYENSNEYDDENQKVITGLVNQSGDLFSSSSRGDHRDYNFEYFHYGYNYSHEKEEEEEDNKNNNQRKQHQHQNKNLGKKSATKTTSTILTDDCCLSNVESEEEEAEEESTVERLVEKVDFIKKSSPNKKSVDFDLDAKKVFVISSDDQYDDSSSRCYQNKYQQPDYLKSSLDNKYSNNEYCFPSIVSPEFIRDLNELNSHHDSKLEAIFFF